MKLFLSIILLIIFSQCFANTYYVQDRSYNTNASDMNRGTDINHPWATWQKAFNTAKAGDTVYFREGTWYLGAGEQVVFNPAAGRGNLGTVSNPIVFMNYPGESPKLDGIRVGDGPEEIFYMANTTNVKLIGLTFQNYLQAKTNDIIRQVQIENNGSIHFENCVSRNSGGYGWTIIGYDTLWLINCDSYMHADTFMVDPYEPGNKADGFAIASGGSDFNPDIDDYTHITGCRAWLCSDDGFEVSTSYSFFIDSTWAFCNGYFNDGQGIGIKYGTGDIRKYDSRITQRCIMAWNKGIAFAFQNLHDETKGAMGTFYNNLVYRTLFGFGVSIGGWDEDNGDYYLNYVNNLVYNNRNTSIDQFNFPEFSAANPLPENIHGHHNTWKWKPGSSYLWEYNDAVSWSLDGEDAQFVSLPDSATTLRIMSAERGMGGSLPDLGSYFQLAPGSVLIDAGSDAGLSFIGSAPDLGPFEYGSLYVQLVSPENGDAFEKDEVITLKAIVEDNFNDISGVDFYINRKTRVGSGEEISPSTWQYIWESDTTGIFTLSAKVTNQQGNTANSSLITIYIGTDNEPGTCKIIPNPNNGIFSIELDEPLSANTNVGIISMDGRFVHLDTMNQNEIVKYFDISHLGSGFYGIVFENAQGVQPCVPLKMSKL